MFIQPIRSSPQLPKEDKEVKSRKLVFGMEIKLDYKNSGHAVHLKWAKDTKKQVEYSHLNLLTFEVNKIYLPRYSLKTFHKLLHRAPSLQSAFHHSYPNTEKSVWR